jgi:hypothetical protein
MARARNLKPNFFKNYELADAGMACQLLFEGLWCLADREGRLEDKPRLIKAELFPYYDVDVNRELTVLARLKFIDRYVVDGIAVIEVRNFKKHQNPHHTEKPSILPGKPVKEAGNPHEIRTSDNNGYLTVNSPLQDGEYLADSLLLIPDSLLLNPSSLIPEIEAEKKEKVRKPKATATRLPTDWKPSDEDIEFCRHESPHLDAKKVGEKFRDYWIAKGGKDALKIDWSATWRNWVRQERIQPQARGSPPQAFKTSAEKGADWMTRMRGAAVDSKIIDLN